MWKKNVGKMLIFLTRNQQRKSKLTINRISRRVFKTTVLKRKQKLNTHYQVTAYSELFILTVCLFPIT